MSYGLNAFLFVSLHLQLLRMILRIAVLTKLRGSVGRRSV